MMPDARCQMPDARCKLQVADYKEEPSKRIADEKE